jgi:hypothetical protein
MSRGNRSNSRNRNRNNNRNKPQPSVKSQSVASPTVPPQTVLTQPVSQPTSQKENIWRWLENNLLLGGIGLIAAGFGYFLYNSSQQFSAILIIVGWLMISASIWRHNFFENNSRNKQILGNVLVSLLLGVAISMTYIIIKPQPVPPTLQPKESVKGILKPANEPSPKIPNDCFSSEKDDITISLGKHIAVTNAQSAILVRMAGETRLSFTRTSEGINLNAVIRNNKNEIVVNIDDGIFNVLPNSGYEAVNKNDNSTLVVFSPDNKIALQVKYLNPSAIVVNGNFYNPKTGQSVDFDKDEIKGQFNIIGGCTRLGENSKFMNM